MSTEQDITKNIQAINPNLEKLKQAFPHCFDKNGDFDFAKFKAELDNNDINIAKEGYSLNWLGKSYARVLASDAATTLLKEDEAHNAKPENVNSQNLLIKGDNLEVLKHLSNAYYEKVKMIYIDPPYNTGSDGFVYNDDRKFTAKQLQDLAGVSEDEAKRILEFTQSNSNSHSAWLTFMYPRLYIAKQLLKDDGVIFVSIDDNEVAQLRLLMDEVFGEENFVSEFVWTGKSGSEDDSHIRNNKEYVLCYSNNINLFIVGLDEKEEASFNFYDNVKGDYYKRQLLRKWGDNSRKEDRPNLYYPIKDNEGKDFYPTLPDGAPGCWRWSKDTMQDAIDDNKIEFLINQKGKLEAYEKIYKSEEKSNTKKFQSLLTELGSSSEGTKEVKSYFNGKKIFSNPKPTKLVKYLIKIANVNNDSLILDFFAGSGSTAHSVLKLNTENIYNLNFITVQLPEPINAKKSKVAFDFVKKELGVTVPTIFEITKERIIRAAKQIKESTATKIADAEKEIAKLKQELPTEETLALIADLENKINHWQQQDLGFKIFETTPIWEDYDFKAEKLANAQKLFDDDKLTEVDVKALFTTWKTYDGCPLTEPVQEIDLAGYKAYYTKQKLYLMHKDFSTATLKALLEQIDVDANFNPTAIIAFGYYFESKALREIAENIKTYNNKKNIDIDFITRY